MRSFCTVFIWPKIQSKTVSREKLHKTLLYEKFAHKIVGEIEPAVNFINILRTKFMYKIAFWAAFSTYM